MLKEDKETIFNKYKLLLQSLGLGVLCIFFQGHGLSLNPIKLNVLINAVIIAPIIEEIIFRYFGFRILVGEKFSRKVFKILTIRNITLSFLFAMFHIFNQGPLLGAAVFFPSLIFGLNYEKSGSLIQPILIHSFYNLIYFLTKI